MRQYIPVLRIGYLVGVSQILGWERANKLGRYGKVAIVDGRQAVSLTAIERAENKSYSSEQIEAALTRPLMSHRSRSHRDAPATPRIRLPKKVSRAKVEAMILDHLRRRDIQWKAWMTRSLNQITIAPE